MAQIRTFRSACVPCISNQPASRFLELVFAPSSARSIHEIFWDLCHEFLLSSRAFLNMELDWSLLLCREQLGAVDFRQSSEPENISLLWWNLGNRLRHRRRIQHASLDSISSRSVPRSQDKIGKLREHCVSTIAKTFNFSFE